MAPEKGSERLVQVWSGIHEVSTIWKTLGLEQGVLSSFQARLYMFSHKDEMKLYTYLMAPSRFSEAIVLL